MKSLRSFVNLLNLHFAGVALLLILNLVLAVRLFLAWSMSAEGQQLNVDVGALRSAHRQVKDRSDMVKFSDVKTMREDAAAVADKADEIKARYVKLFRV